MNALVLYDSQFGNTERVAEALALALQQAVPTRLASVDDVESCSEALRDVDLLVVGAPTHRHDVSEEMRRALACLADRAMTGIRVATFDTRLHGPRFVTGSAAVRLARFARHHGAWIVVPPESFAVEGREGPLDAGELEHAGAWAQEILREVGVAVPV